MNQASNVMILSFFNTKTSNLLHAYMTEKDKDLVERCKMVTLDLRVAKEGIAFYKIGEREYIECSKNADEALPYKMITAIVNLSFGIELFLKSMINNPWGHDLSKLFNNLEEDTRDAVMHVTMGLMKEWGSACAEEQFHEYLDTNKVAFEDWRYFYQRGGNANILFLYALGTALYGMIGLSMRSVKKEE